MPRLTLQQANAIVDTAIAKARESGGPPIAVVVIDDGGHLKAAQREDGASMFRIDAGLGKAWGAVAMDEGSRGLAKRAKANPGLSTRWRWRRPAACCPTPAAC